MIYTIGHTESYCRLHRERLVARTSFQKKGRTDNYRGGSVWESEEKARQLCSMIQSVFGVLADWEQDTEPSIFGNWHELLIDADLVMLIDCEEEMT